MKKMFFCLALLIASTLAFSQDFNLSKPDLQNLLQKSIGIAQLQTHLPKDENGTTKQLYVYYYAPQFIPVDLILSDGRKQLQFREITTSESDIAESFFLFERLNISDNHGQLSFKFFNNTPGQKKLVNVSLNVTKQGNDWVIGNPQIIIQ
jgi:hypothetical protein